MKVVISKEQILSLIAKMQNIIPTKPAVNILSNVLLQAVDDQLIVTATDLTVSMQCFVDAKVIDEGSVTLPARKFFYLIKEITSAQIKISSIASSVTEITAGNSVFKLHSLPQDEFPPFPDLSSSTTLSIESSTLKDLLIRSSFSVAKEDSLYILNGVLLQVANQCISFIGTDGKRLAKTSAKVDIDPSYQGVYVLPSKAVDELVRSLDDSNTKIQLGLMHDKISLERPNLILITKLLSGDYPEVERIIPKNPKISVRLHKEELIAMLKQVALFTADTTASVRFLFDEGQLQLSASSKQVGEGKVVMPADYFGDPLEVAFNPYYFLDILRHCKDEEDETILFSIDNPFDPGKITGSTSAVFVIMPMRITEPNYLQKNVSKEASYS